MTTPALASDALADRPLWRDLVMLTKPTIISLLLVTTAAPMYIAGRPDLWLLAFYVNVLTAALALGGFYFYVFIYTRWLKRTTPQNIVIGGAAGAFPPLVGWAAVTGRVDLTAIYLFLIVFYWTPPHFWALALNKQRDYGNARVPMAPLVWGERETMRQMFWYTIVLLVVTLLPVTYGAFGVIYAVCATLFGGLLLGGVVRMMRATDWVKPAWWVYGYSLLYLALLFVAMVVDRQLAL